MQLHAEVLLTVILACKERKHIRILNRIPCHVGTLTFVRLL